MRVVPVEKIQELILRLRSSAAALHECEPETPQGVQYWHDRLSKQILNQAAELSILVSEDSVDK